MADLGPRDEPRGSGAWDAEQPIELRRHLNAIRRNRTAIVFFVLVTTAATLAISLALPKTYRATATIVREDVGALLSNQDAASVERELATIERLITTPTILDDAAERLGRDGKDLEGKVSSSVSPDANLISVTATAEDADDAALIANSVARAFLASEREAQADRLQFAREKLTQELERLRREGGSQVEIEALRSRLSDLSVQEAAIGADLELAQLAEPPEEPSSPRPVRNALLAFFGSLFLAVLAALGREQLTPRVGGPRDIGRVLDLPIFGGIPFTRRRLRSRSFVNAAEYEAYQTLQTTLRFQLPPDKQRIVLVTSALAGEGKTTVTANLGRALARGGDKTLLISADLRRPKLHELLDVKQSPGLIELLASLERSGGENGKAAVARVGKALERGGNLAVLPTGTPDPEAPRALLRGGSFGAFVDALRQTDYDYILIDSPPLLGLADSHVLARYADAVILVTRPDKLTLDDVIETRDLLERMEIVPLGVVVVGAKREASYYYTRAVPTLENV